MTVSIIVCSRNRAESLRSTLVSIGNAAIPVGWNVELLVINNGSTDGTRAAVNEVRSGKIFLRYLEEPRLGLSYARNTGLLNSSGEIILWTDDDVRVPSNWIEGMCRPIVDNVGDAVVGGVGFPESIAMALSHPPFSSHHSWFASTDGWLDRRSPHSLVGANMAFHRRVLGRVPGFDVELGPGALGFCEESLFSAQLLAAGFILVGALDLCVEHHFDVARLTTKSLLHAARKMGRSDAFIFHHWKHRRSRLVVPRLLWAYARRSWRRFPDWISGELSEETIQAEHDVAFCREYIVQRRRRRKYSFQGLLPEPNSAE